MWTVGKVRMITPVTLVLELLSMWTKRLDQHVIAQPILSLWSLFLTTWCEATDKWRKDLANNPFQVLLALINRNQFNLSNDKSWYSIIFVTSASRRILCSSSFTLSLIVLIESRLLRILIFLPFLCFTCRHPEINTSSKASHDIFVSKLHSWVSWIQLSSPFPNLKWPLSYQQDFLLLPLKTRTTLFWKY